MSGPVWRFEHGQQGTCDGCLKEVAGLFVEGAVADNHLAQERRLCPDCYVATYPFLMRGEAGARIAGPAYARRG